MSPCTGPGELLKVFEEGQGWYCCLYKRGPSGLTWEGLQALQDGGHGHLFLQGAVTEVFVVQEAEQPSELREQLLQHWGRKKAGGQSGFCIQDLALPTH